MSIAKKGMLQTADDNVVIHPEQSSSTLDCRRASIKSVNTRAVHNWHEQYKLHYYNIGVFFGWLWNMTLYCFIDKNECWMTLLISHGSVFGIIWLGIRSNGDKYERRQTQIGERTWLAYADDIIITENLKVSNIEHTEFEIEDGWTIRMTINGGKTINACPCSDDKLVNKILARRPIHFWIYMNNFKYPRV